VSFAFGPLRPMRGTDFLSRPAERRREKVFNDVLDLGRFLGVGLFGTFRNS